MGRIVARASIENLQDSSSKMQVDLLVHTAAAYLTLPLAWKERLGNLRSFGTVRTQFADQKIGTAEVFGPVLLKINGFREINTEVLFLDMQPAENGGYEPLLGYIPLEQASTSSRKFFHFLDEVLARPGWPGQPRSGWSRRRSWGFKGPQRSPERLSVGPRMAQLKPGATASAPSSFVNMKKLIGRRTSAAVDMLGHRLVPAKCVDLK